MAANRTWALGRSSDRLGPIWFPVVGPILEPGEEVTVVEESRLREAEAELARANEALRECTRLSGADLSDGFPTWPSLPDFAVEQVRQLRADYDEDPTPRGSV